MLGRLPRLVAITLPFFLALVPARAHESVIEPGAGVEATTVAQALPGPVGERFSKAETEAFFDGLMHALLEDHHVAGAAVSVVRDGAVLLAKGYGFDDVEARQRVDPDLTLFRVGSISKTFTWTALMQLVEAGQLDINADIRGYIDDFDIPDTYEQPITLKDLMTHTPGFEDQVLGLFARDESHLLPLAEILRREMPARVRAPGTVASYSNHGTGIAGYIVEQVSGQDWNAYVEQHIFQPLGMDHATFRQPIPEGHPGRMSKGYRWTGRFVEEPFEFVPLAPVGSASISAVDMARFMVAHLQLGELDGRRILREETARTMQSDLFRHAPHMNAVTHGFYEMSRNGERVIGHGGDTLWFHSEMALLPAHGVGVFVSTNSAGGAALTRTVYEAFMDEFYPGTDPQPLAADGAATAQLERFAGRYRPNRYSHSTLAKLAAAFAVVRVEVSADGELRLSSSGTDRWVQVDPLTFRERFGERYLAFRENDAGTVTHMFMSQVPIVAFERVGFWGDPRLHASVAGFAVLMQVGALLLWPLAALVRRRHHYVHTRLVPATARSIAWIACLLMVAFSVLVALALSNPNDIVFGPSTALTAALTMPLLAVPFAFGSLGFAASMWRRRQGGFWWRCVYTGVAASFVGAYWLLWYWNLLGYRY